MDTSTVVSEIHFVVTGAHNTSFKDVSNSDGYRKEGITIDNVYINDNMAVKRPTNIILVSAFLNYI